MRSAPLPTRAPRTAPAPVGPAVPAAGARRAAPLGWLVGGGLVAVGIALRFVTRSPLWLDEALSVNIASLPVDDLLEALRRDGHPPLYYLVLHAWMRVVGEGDLAVRALSGVFSLATLALAWPAGRRLGGRWAAASSLVLVATSPFAVRYATETRMYSLVSFLVLAGWLLVRGAFDGEGVVRRPLPVLAGIAAITGALLLTHYWAFYLLTVVGAVLVVAAWRGHRRAAVRVLAAMAVGTLAFVPWLPTFLDQAASTGTPWGRPDRPASIAMITLTDFGGGPWGEAQVLGIALATLAALALFGRTVDRWHIELDLRTRSQVRAETAVVVGTMLLATAAAFATGSAYASRYAAVVFPLFLLLAGLGITRIGDTGVRVAVLAVLVLASLYGGSRNVLGNRTQAADIAAAINARAQSNDVVAYCPDQLGPAVNRELRDDLDELTFPDGARPERVNWVDYEARMAAADPEAFAESLDERAAGRTIWLVWQPGYRTLDDHCETIAEHLTAARTDARSLTGTDAPVVVRSGREFEHAWLSVFAPR